MSTAVCSKQDNDKQNAHHSPTSKKPEHRRDRQAALTTRPGPQPQQMIKAGVWLWHPDNQHDQHRSGSRFSLLTRSPSAGSVTALWYGSVRSHLPRTRLLYMIYNHPRTHETTITSWINAGWPSARQRSHPGSMLGDRLRRSPNIYLQHQIHVLCLH